MSLSILTNISALNTNRNLQQSSNAVAKAMQDLSSGLRINTAADDAAGYAISQNMTSQVNGYNQASQNIGDATNMVQTAETALNGIQSMLQRVYELGVQYQNGDLSTADQQAIQDEVNQLTDEISRQSSAVQFNGIQLLNGKANGGANVTFQVGANSADTLTACFASILGNGGTGAAGSTWMGLSMTGFTWGFAGNAKGVAVFTLGADKYALTTLSNAITNISNYAANLGAVQNRLQYAANEVSSISENLSAANSSIQEVDMASEMTKMTQEQVLQQAGTAMLSQANAEPQLVLKLLGG